MSKLAPILLAVMLPASALAAVGEVTFLEGSATRAPVKGAKVGLKMKSTVEQGDLIRTGPKSRLEITLADKSVIRLGPSAKLRVDTAQFTDEGRDFKATLLLGKVWSKVTGIFGNDRSFEVRTERAVAGVRGTIFQVNAAKSKAVLVKVYTGTVAVAGSSMPTAAPPKGERVQVAGPQQVSRQQWEKIVSAMMQVKVGADGVPEDPQRFSEKDEEKDAWARWNRERDLAE